MCVAVAQQFDPCRPVAILFWIFTGETVANRYHSGLRLRQRGAGFEACDHLQMKASTATFENPAHRNPYLLGGNHELEPARHNPNDAERVAIQRDVLSQRVGIAAELPLPETVAQHGHGGSAGFILFRTECPAEQWAHTEQREEVGRNTCPAQPLRLRDAAKGNLVGGCVPGGHVLEDVILRFKVEIVWRRGVSLGAWRLGAVILADRDQPLRIPERQRPQQKVV